MTSAQRAKLRSLANGIDVVIFVGKDGVTENLLKQADDALEARQLIKGTVQKNCEYSAREICDILAEKLGAESVQALGRKFTLYRRSSKEGKEALI